MIPASLSMLPVTAILAEYINRSGWSGIYPYWYLGAPLRYLTGPLVPGLLILTNRLTHQPFLTLTVWLIISGVIVGAIGLVWFTSRLISLAQSSREQPQIGLVTSASLAGVIAGVAFLVNPWLWSQLLNQAEASTALAILLLPWLGLVLLNLINRPLTVSTTLIGSIVISLYILINTNILLDTALVTVILCLVSRNKTKDINPTLGKIVGWLGGGIALASLWYGLDYWWQLIFVPGIGGRPALSALGNLFKTLGNLVPLGLVIFGVSKWGRKLSAPARFVVLWLASFITLSLWRFLNDPDFVADWTSWGIEIALGIAMATGLLISYAPKRLRLLPTAYCLIFLFYLGGWWWSIKHSSSWLPRVNLESTYEYQTITQLREAYQECSHYPLTPNRYPLATCGRFFVSGSITFWFNALAPDIPQVRGGRDTAAINPDWRQGMYIFRESTNPDEIIAWIDRLGIEWILVHGPNSTEPYHDFTHPEVYSQMPRLKLISQDQGDYLYQVTNPTGVPPVTKDHRAWWGRLSALIVAGIFSLKNWERLVSRILRRLALT